MSLFQAAVAIDVAKQIVACETTDHPTEGQLVAMTHKYFLKHDGMLGTSTPT